MVFSSGSCASSEYLISDLACSTTVASKDGGIAAYVILDLETSCNSIARTALR